MKLFRKVSIYSVFIWLIIFAVIPLIFVVGASFLTRSTETFVKLPFTLQNYKNLINPLYLKIFNHSLVFAVICTAICILIGYPFAFIVARAKEKYRTWLLFLVIIPFWTSCLIRTYAIVAILKTKGLLNALLLHLGIIHQPLSLLYSNLAVIIGSVYDLLPFMVLPIYSAVEKLDQSLVDASYDLGASKWRTFWKIILPLTSSGIWSGSVLVFLPAMTMFYIPVLLGGAKDLLLGNLIQYQFSVVNNWPSGAAISISLVALMCVCLFVFSRHNNRHKGKALPENVFYDF